MPGARSLLLISLATVAIPADRGTAQALFQIPNFGQPPAQTETYLPPDADPNYSTPGGYDKDVDMHLTTRKEVSDPTGEPATLFMPGDAVRFEAVERFDEALAVIA